MDNEEIMTEQSDDVIAGGADENETLSYDNGVTESSENTEQAQETEQVWDGSKYVFKYKGQDIVPKSRDHLLQLASRGHMYDQDQQAVKRAQLELEQQKQALQKYMDIDKHASENPELFNQIQEVVQKFQSGSGLSDDLDPVVGDKISALQKEIEDLKGFKNTVSEQQAEQQLESEMNELMNTYSQYDWEVDTDGTGSLYTKILKHALDTGATSMRTAFRDYMFDSISTSSKAEALKEQKQNRVEAQKAGKIGGGVAPRPANSSIQYSKNDSYQTLSEKAKQMI